MKYTPSFLLLLVICALNFSGCQKPIDFVEGSGPTSTYNPVKTTFMSAKVNGTLVECESVGTRQDMASNILQIKGVSGAKNFTFTFFDFKGAKEYDAADPNSLGSYQNAQSDPSTDNFFATSGKVIITNLTGDKIEGTFEFKAINPSADSVAVTEGKFSSKIIKQ